MSDTEQIDHAWFREHIAAALADGLEPRERAAFEAHAAACPACAAELSSYQQLEQRMSTLFAPPAVGLEDRIVASLRNVREGWRPRIRIHPAVAKAASGIAAGILLAAFGYAITQHLDRLDSRVVSTASGHEQRRFRENFDRHPFTQRVDPADSKKIPNDTLRYPTNWPDTSRLNDSSPAPQSRWHFDDAKQNLGPVKDSSGVEDRTHRTDMSLSNSDAYTGTVGKRFTASAGSAGTSIAGIEGTHNVNGPAQMPRDHKMSSGEGVSNVAGGSVVSNGGTLSVPTGASGGFALNIAGRAGDADGDGVARNNLISKDSLNLYFKPTQMGNDASGADVAQQVSELDHGAVVQDQGVKLGHDFAMAGGKQSSHETTDAPGAQAAAPPAQPSAPPPPESPREATSSPIARKVIRNGQVEFEVDRFDTAYSTVVKLTAEANGYVGTTDSEKLPNGKVKGTVTVRIPPDRLDTLITQLRGIGDLKSQKLDANDVTKHYTDLESELRADRAMEDRLLGLIKEGKGQIKDLLAAEKELGTWREKIENIVGEMRYLDSQVAMSTLVITLYERDIRTPATATQSENIDAGMEVSDVEKARADALKAIEEAKGRVIESNLKRYDAGQFGATIVAEVPPDAAGPMLDRLKQIGKLARLDIQRKQTTESNADSNAPQKVQKKDTRLNLSIYNLANVAPRTTATMNLAADDVEKTYHGILDAINKTGGRVISSDLARSKADKPTGTISFDVPSAQADAVMNELRGMGEVIRLSVTDNPDVNNVTTAKRGFALQLVATASIPPRETTTMTIATAKVRDAREKILAAATSAAARVLVSQLNESDPNNPNAAIEIDVPRANLAAVEKALADAGDTVSRNVARSADTENTLDTKVKLQISLLPADKLPPRETTSLTIETGDVDSALNSVQSAATSASGKILDSNESKERDGSTRGTLVVETPLANAASLIDQAKQAGSVRAAQSSRNLQSPPGNFAKARIELTFVTPETIVQPGTGPLATIRNGLSTSVKALLWSLELIVIGACTVLPFVLLLWAGRKLMKRRKSVTPTT